MSVSRKITVKQVAESADVSFSTAAAALRGDAWVRETTRQRVLKWAQTLGYRRHPAASILGSRRHLDEHSAKPIAVGWLTGTKASGILRKLRHAEALAKSRGWIFHHHDLNSIDEASVLAEKWEALGIDGIILGRTHQLEGILPFPWERFTVISTELQRLKEGFDVVRPSQFKAVLGLLRTVRSRGYRRIGLWLRQHAPILPEDETRLAAAMLFQNEDLSARTRLPILRTSFVFDDYASKLRKWLERHQPDVLVGFHSHDLWMLQDFFGLKIPDDLPFAALHVGWEERSQVAGILDREFTMPEAVYPILERKLRSGFRGLSEHPQESVFDAAFSDGPSLPDRSR